MVDIRRIFKDGGELTVSPPLVPIGGNGGVGTIVNLTQQGKGRVVFVFDDDRVVIADDGKVVYETEKVRKGK